jgi:hypothetical protein
MHTNDSKQSKVEQLLRAYLAAFSKMDSGNLDSCFLDYAVVDLPMIKPTRLCGLREIRRGQELAFENISKVDLELTEIVSDENSAMGSGRLSIECRGESESHEFAVSAFHEDGKLKRLSWFLDARELRPWSDCTVL